MSTASAVATLPPPLALDRRDARPGMARLTLVELRKMTDTRAGFWLQVSVVALSVAVTVLYLIFAEAGDQTFAQILGVAIAPASILLPVVGILLVSSEWSQRTAMITFTLVPRRSRAFWAKVLASIVLSVAGLAAGLVVAAVATAFAPDATWSLSAALLGQMWVSLSTGMVSGVAFGALLLASAPAIVTYFALPTALGALGAIPALSGTAEWVDGSRSLVGLTEHVLSAEEWARAGTTLALWMLLPLLLGLWRILRADVR